MVTHLGGFLLYYEKRGWEGDIQYTKGKESKFTFAYDIQIIWICIC